MSTPTGLGCKMRELAALRHPRAEELRLAAHAFEEATDKLSPPGKASSTSPNDYQAFLGAWARARRIYTECAGVGIMED